MNTQRPILRAVRAALALLIAAFLVFAPPYLLRGLSKDYVRDVFELKPVEWKGVIQIWHIVDFRTYQGSVTKHLRERAEAYCKAHPGVYIEVTGLTLEQFSERYARGERPDAYSFPCGLLYREQLRPLDLSLPELRAGLRAAEADGQVFAVPYLMSGYFLFLNTQRAYLSGAQLPASIEEANLQAAMDAKELSIPSVQAARLRLTGASADIGAFRSGKLAYAVMDARALGDLQRAENGNLLFSAIPMAGYTEQVQYLAAASGTDDKRCAIIAELSVFLLTAEEQSRLAALGAIPVISDAEAAYADRLLADWNEACTAPDVPDALLYQRHREALEADALRALGGETGASDAFFERLAVVLGGQS